MGLTKTENFTIEQNELAALLKALGHPARIAIVQFLIKSNACMCGDIVDVLPLAQPTVSQHLKELKNVGLIKGTIEGTSICYCINDETWNRFKSILNGLFEQYQSKKSCC